jgi:hypothetical protein
MTAEIRILAQRRERGQTIIVALIMLGLLLIIGFVFIGIVNRNIKTSSRLQDRSEANDLSEAGIRFAHGQMLRSELGADWRGTPTPPVSGSTADLTVDPDAFFLRPPAILSDGSRTQFLPGVGAPVDLGGPDGLGPFFRVNFANGRALVRVRYAQSDANLFRADQQGPLRSPGLARNYIIIESVGREGRVNTNDPTTLLSGSERRIANFASEAAFQTELNLFRQDQARYGSIQINRAFASIGIIEHALFVTNKNRTTRPAELGIPAELGASYRGTAVSPFLFERVGTTLPLLTLGTGATSSLDAGSFPGGGSTHINGDLKLYGATEFNLVAPLGDQVTVAGDIGTDDTGSVLRLNVTRYAANGQPFIEDGQPGVGGTQPILLGPNQFTSNSAAFQTFGILRDGKTELDLANRPRDIGYKTPPSILERDPQTGATRYVSMSRNSGVQVGTGNAGRFGHGRNPYIDNGSSRQTPVGSGSRAAAGAANALFNEWLSPGGDPLTTGWRGFLYAPPGATMELLSDGFTIQRDGTGDEARWRRADGSLTDTNFIRYRLGRGTGGDLRIVNTFTFADPTRIDAALASADFDAGQPFGGVVYFEGNVRIRGVIPTDIQMTVVSNATIYIEGSITKGVTGNHYTSTYPVGPTSVGTRLQRLSRSMLMLMAKDNVAVNTTQFFGVSRFQAIQPKEDVPSVGSLNPIVMRAGDPNGLRMVADFVLDPENPNLTLAQRLNPSAWRPYPQDYVIGATALNTSMLVTHTMDNGAAASTFFSLDINTGAGASSYFFPATNLTLPVPFTNLASEYLPGTTIPLYGLGSETYERYTQFESLALPLVDPGNVTVNPTTDSFTATGAFGSYTLRNTGLNDLRFRPASIGGLGTNDYLLGRFAITPHDVRIEASVYAEEGSFFVIPGAWFNPNPNDTYSRWLEADNNLPTPNLSDPDHVAYLHQRRLDRFGAYPETPFYGEPLDVRIQVIGSVSQNMTVPMSVKAEWLRKWGWIPEFHGSSGTSIPAAHMRGITPTNADDVFPNLTITYDPVLATGRQNGFVTPNNEASSPILRTDDYGRPLPPLPRLPVSPTLAYFGEVR